MHDAGFLDALPAAMDAVGTARFEKQLADAIGCALSYDFITMARYSVHEKPRFLIHSYTFPSHMAELYLSQFVDADPYIEHWRSAEEPGVVWLQDIAFSRKRYRRYTEVFLPQIGVCDEIGVFMPAVARDSVAFFYNRREQLFSPEDVEAARTVFDAAAALYRLHIRTLLAQEGAARDGSPSLGNPARATSGSGATIWYTNEWSAQQRPDLALVEVAGAEPAQAPETYRATPLRQERAVRRASLAGWVAQLGLTPREREIVAAALTGEANAGIAAALGLSVGNVKNHKRRIYAKLDIASERDLLAMYIAAMSSEAG
ncbi:response regulator transcription factor [Roseovarius sp. S1116L3]|uniref:response regulator transcription factor n=1 Tax=Roseovarius roseus TaxID=3342636 RepID=UPI003728D126